MEIWGRVLQAKGTVSAKVLGWEQAWCVSSIARREMGGLRGRKKW